MKINLFKKDAVCPFLFHGTSTYHLDSIKENGFKLDEDKIVFNSIPVSEMFSELKERFIEDLGYSYNGEYYSKPENITDEADEGAVRCLILGERYLLNNNVDNFDYTNTYVTNCVFRALTYACNSKMGIGSVGECLKNIVNLYYIYHKLTNNYYEFKNEKSNAFINTIFNKETNQINKDRIKPMIVVLKNVPVSDLQSEDGKGNPFSGMLIHMIGKVKFDLEALKKDDFKACEISINEYIKSQDSQRYMGGNIPFSEVDIIIGDDESDLSDKLSKYLNENYSD